MIYEISKLNLIFSYKKIQPFWENTNIYFFSLKNYHYLFSFFVQKSLRRPIGIYIGVFMDPTL